MSPPSAFLEDFARVVRAGPGDPAGGQLWCTGLHGGALAAGLATLDEGASVVVPTREEADKLVRALRYFKPRVGVRLYPADDTRPFDGTSPDVDLVRRRIAVRAELAEGTPLVVVIPAKALLARVPVEEPSFRVRPGDVLDRDALLAWLIARGYLVAQKVEDPATIAVRGGTLDVWPAGAPRPVRIELFDDEVESIHPYDPDTQRLIRRRAEGGKGPGEPVVLDVATLHPAREAALDDASAERAAAYLHAVATERGHQGPQRRVLQDLRNGIWFPGAEDYLPALTTLQPLRPSGRLFVVEPDRVREELQIDAHKAEDRLAGVRLEDRPLVRAFDRYCRPEEVDLGGAVAVARLGVRAPGRVVVDFGCRDNLGLKVGSGELEPVVKALRRLAGEGRAVTFVVESETRAERVRALFDAHELRFGAGRAKPRQLTMDQGELPEGFAAEHRVFVTAAEVFGDKLAGETSDPSASPERASSRLRKASRRSFSSVKRGDFVVHAKHGIGLFAGIARMPLGVGEGDFATVEYRDGQKLYVPLDRLDLLTPYQAVEGQAAPRVDKLGGSTWDARKAKVRDAVLRMASELLLLYAKRSLAKAPVYDHRQELYWRFAEAFPYVETPDQETAIRDVLHDLGSGQPMDRLLVGDVGFGKTEVSMRAAAVAVLGGAQVAVLCPTSVLALQHGESFRRRFEGLPVRIETLSRLRPPHEEKAVRKDLAEGKVDIVIGTTRLLSGQLRFKNLGLLVIDEEHRFGAGQKEELKQRFGSVHTLALSATPIPRTLQMALSGIRTLSVLATPPLGRQRIRTEIVRFGPDRIREDILYELRRGGQVYFIHNRVQSIDGVAKWLRKLVPEAQIEVAHGQMEPATLERAIARFIRAESNVLLSTAIVESGIDLPLVNTMIINRGEQFGLAQLYQLRGRIGRGSVRGHCTILVSSSPDRPPEAATGERKKAPERDAMSRLRVLADHDELGSNFALATRDLELRGSGEILGEKQHGHIAAIGFDAYLEMLDEAVARAKGELVRQQIDPDVDVPVTSLLPDTWIPDVPERLDAYQRIALARTRSAVRAVIAELEERYEEVPVEARNLGWLAEARIRCRELGVDRFAVHKVRAVVRIHPSSTLPLTSLDALCAALPNRFKRVAERELEVRFSLDEGAQPFRLIDWVCGKLAEPPAAPLGGIAPPSAPRPPPPPDPKAAPDTPRAPMRRIAKKTSWRP